VAFSREHPPRPSPAIALVIAFQALLAILFLLPAGRGIWTLNRLPDDPKAATTIEDLLGLLFLIAILWIVIAIGMFKLRKWFRWLSLILVSAAVLAGGFGKIFYKRSPGFDFTPALIELSLWISIPLSVWWWIVLNLPGVRRQFH
jgi:hypothetical protein